MVIGSRTATWLRSFRTYDSGLVQEVPTTTPRWRSSGSRSYAPTAAGKGAPLVLLNHWVTPPSPELASRGQRRGRLLDGPSTAQRNEASPVNLVAVDFAGSGDLLATVDALSTQLLTSRPPRCAWVRAFGVGTSRDRATSRSDGGPGALVDRTARG